MVEWVPHLLVIVGISLKVYNSLDTLWMFCHKATPVTIITPDH